MNPWLRLVDDRYGRRPERPAAEAPARPRDRGRPATLAAAWRRATTGEREWLLRQTGSPHAARQYPVPNDFGFCLLLREAFDRASEHEQARLRGRGEP